MVFLKGALSEEQRARIVRITFLVKKINMHILRSTGREQKKGPREIAQETRRGAQSFEYSFNF